MRSTVTHGIVSALNRPVPLSGEGSDTEQEFRPFYSSVDADRASAGGYFSVRREPRALSEQQRRDGARRRGRKSG